MLYKLKNSYIDRMIDARISKSEVSFILHIAQYQDNYGIVHSVYYKDICAAINISTQKFYDILNTLAKKRLISFEKVNPADFKVCLINNDFSDKNFKQGYINVAEKDFRRSSFVSMKAGAQLLYLFTQRFTKGKHMLLNNFYEEFCEKFHIKHKTLQLYLQELKEKKYLFISKKRNKAYHYEVTMQPSRCLDKKGIIPHEKEGYEFNIKKLILANFGRYLSEADESSINIVAGLVNQQRALIYSDFPSLIVEAIKNSFKLQREEKKKTVSFNAALINRFLTQKLAQGII